MAALTTAAAVTVGSSYLAYDAAKDAADAQQESAQAAIDSNDAALEQARADRQPFTDIGLDAGDDLTSFLDNKAQTSGDREQQLLDLAQSSQREVSGEQQLQDLINTDATQTDTFQDLYSNAQREILASNVSRGKLSSGDTLQDLTTASASIAESVKDSDVNRLLTTLNYGDSENATNYNNLYNALSFGEQADNSEFNQIFNTVSLGSNSASGQATSTLNTAGNNSSLLTDAGNAEAAGIVGSTNAITSGASGLTSLLGYGIS